MVGRLAELRSAVAFHESTALHDATPHADAGARRAMLREAVEAGARFGDNAKLRQENARLGNARAAACPPPLAQSAEAETLRVGVRSGFAPASARGPQRRVSRMAAVEFVWNHAGRQELAGFCGRWAPARRLCSVVWGLADAVGELADLTSALCDLVKGFMPDEYRTFARWTENSTRCASAAAQNTRGTRASGRARALCSVRCDAESAVPVGAVGTCGRRALEQRGWMFGQTIAWRA
jgi:hypothetical protein